MVTITDKVLALRSLPSKIKKEINEMISGRGKCYEENKVAFDKERVPCVGWAVSDRVASEGPSKMQIFKHLNVLPLPPY